jgi:hypothetical protein
MNGKQHVLQHIFATCLAQAMTLRTHNPAQNWGHSLQELLISAAVARICRNKQLSPVIHQICIPGVPFAQTEPIVTTNAINCERPTLLQTDTQFRQAGIELLQISDRTSIRPKPNEIGALKFDCEIRTPDKTHSVEPHFGLAQIF